MANTCHLSPLNLSPVQSVSSKSLQELDKSFPVPNRSSLDRYLAASTNEEGIRPQAVEATPPARTVTFQINRPSAHLAQERSSMPPPKSEMARESKTVPKPPALKPTYSVAHSNDSMSSMSSMSSQNSLNSVVSHRSLDFRGSRQGRKGWRRPAKPAALNPFVKKEVSEIFFAEAFYYNDSRSLIF